ncbi:Gfo/Idh/MocA family oxidoreductase [Cytophagaceae bacterium DM2B3-1]|uniref:Gfo/Idh/MocA family oxidoreductase n=1 Tax=Xanthocytophaga flava TaxID=3048013 RepID=A0ABT7CMK2_9BACT|nr:Gfo/Idh/MocA family oxidoreductase [Xanthocytophaga flavus]MDJ1494212.1 Gfo/Idh/MocA family oxidoreductase [Xanthocytophaga flavus]
MDRRSFLKQSSFAFVAGSVIQPNWGSSGYQEKANVRLAFIGVGLRGRNHLQQALYRPDVEITAIADIDPAAVKESNQMIQKSGRKAATVYSGEKDFEKLVQRSDIDGVVISTPWQWHTPMAIAAMKAGKYVGLEVPAMVTLKEAWDLVETHEKTGTHLMLLENVCYRRDVMAVLNMVRQGLFGEMLYAHCGYEHDLRPVKFNDGKQPYGGGVEFGEKGLSEAHWRTQHSVDRNGDLYPTHGIGPVAEWLNINRGNRFIRLSSMATKSRGLHKYIVDNGGESHPNAKVNFKLGDIVTTSIQCQNGENVVIIHDTNSPRPYSLGFRAQGTEGIWMNDGNQIYLAKVSPKHDQWEPFADYQAKYDHPLWKRFEKDAENAGHGGMDFFVLRTFIESVKRKLPPPIDVYDAVTWSAISPLSEESISKGGSLIEFPDFTKGKWSNRKPVFALNDDF